jgi:hypothetical protein
MTVLVLLQNRSCTNQGRVYIQHKLTFVTNQSQHRSSGQKLLQRIEGLLPTLRPLNTFAFPQHFI